MDNKEHGGEVKEEGKKQKDRWKGRRHIEEQKEGKEVSSSWSWKICATQGLQNWYLLIYNDKAE